MRKNSFALLAGFLSIIIASRVIGLSNVYAQDNFTIQIQEPADGAVISGSFRLHGIATVPPEKQLTLVVTSATSGTVLATQSLPVSGDVGTQGTFDLSISFNVAGDTPVVIQVVYRSPNDGSVIAVQQVHVTLQKAGTTGAPTLVPPPSAIPPTASAPTLVPAPTVVSAATLPSSTLTAIDPMLAAAQLALGDYEARTQIVTPIVINVQTRTFNNSCLELGHPNEQCSSDPVDGSVVKLSYGGAIFTYHVGNNQARMNRATSASLKHKQEGIPKLLSDAATAMGATLYLPQRLTGPFQGLPLNHIGWDNGVVTMIYSLDGNPTSFTVIEKALPSPSPLSAAGQGVASVTIGTYKAPIQNSGVQQSISWAIDGTLVTLNVPSTISVGDLTDLANGFAVLGSTQPGQINPLDSSNFDKLTVALPEPIRSAEMARQAFLDLVNPLRKGHVIAVQSRIFTDTCLELPRFNEPNCEPTPGYVIGIADTELYRYHVAGNSIRLFRDNSALLDKLSEDYASPAAAQAAVKFHVVAPTDSNLILTGVQGITAQAAPSVTLFYHDQASGGSFSLVETAAGNVPAVQPAIADNLGVVTATFAFPDSGPGQTLIALWASPELGASGIARVKNSFTAQ